jgi:hypothetical protein
MIIGGVSFSVPFLITRDIIVQNHCAFFALTC